MKACSILYNLMVGLDGLKMKPADLKPRVLKQLKAKDVIRVIVLHTGCYSNFA